MQIILLSGGSGKRLWPLSNDNRSKQFLKLLSLRSNTKCNSELNAIECDTSSKSEITSSHTSPRNDGQEKHITISDYYETDIRESMLQRVMRQLKESNIKADINIATSFSQKDVIINQLGEDICIITEPERRDTFPSIALASSYLKYEKGCDEDEIVVVMPCDSYTDLGYFETIVKMTKAIKLGVADLVLMGIEPTYPSTKYGYIVPDSYVIASELQAKCSSVCSNLSSENSAFYKVKRFIEKPDELSAKTLIEKGAFWNGGVFAFRLGYLSNIVKKYIDIEQITQDHTFFTSKNIFSEIRKHYCAFPKISFDYEVVEKAQSVAVVKYSGKWKDLGTWNTLTEELNDASIGNVIMTDTDNTHIINELELPIMCIGTKDIVIAASPDGILVSDKKQSEKIKIYADKLQHRLMYEERYWGEYKVIDEISLKDGHKVLTKQILIYSGRNISYQTHQHREEFWTVIDGEGLLVLNGQLSKVSRGDTVHIKKGTKHAIKAISDLRIIEVQSGDLLIEEDICRFDWEW